MPKTFPAVSDHSWARPDPSYILASGYLGVGRYLGYDTVTTPRDITKTEMQSYYNAGLDVFFIVQAGKDSVKAGWQQGVQHADMANALLYDLGIPTDVWIVSTVVDYEATVHELRGGIADYARGFKSRSNYEHIPYGSALTLDILCGEQGMFPFGWQTRAWSYGRTSAYACMTQETGYVLGGTSDHNNILYMQDVEKLLWHPDERSVPPKKDEDMPTTIIMTTSRNNRAWLTRKGHDGVSPGMLEGMTNAAGEPIDGNGNVLPEGWNNAYAGLGAWEVQDTHFDIRKLSPDHHQWLLGVKYAQAAAGQPVTILDAGFVTDEDLSRRTYKPSFMCT